MLTAEIIRLHNNKTTMKILIWLNRLIIKMTPTLVSKRATKKIIKWKTSERMRNRKGLLTISYLRAKIICKAKANLTKFKIMRSKSMKLMMKILSPYSNSENSNLSQSCVKCKFLG